MLSMLYRCLAGRSRDLWTLLSRRIWTLGVNVRPLGRPPTYTPIFGNAKRRGTRVRRLVRGERRAAAGALLLVWLWACGCDATGLPHGAQRFTAPAQYRAWWALTEACSGLHGDFNAVTWYVVPHADSFSLEGASVNGVWYGGRPNRIVLGDSVKFVGSLVRHEMLHALLQVVGHPRQQFLGNCSDIVVCIEKCVSDAGGPPDTSGGAPLLATSALSAAVLIAPDTESVSADSGWVTVTLSVTNTTRSPGRVQVPVSDSTPLTDVNLHWRPPDIVAGEDAFFLDYYFTLAPSDSAGSVRRVVFDEQVTLVNPPPQITFSGSFGPYPAPARVLTVTP